MDFINISELRLRATQIVREIEETGKKVIVTKNGKPVVLIRPITKDDFILKEERRAGDKKRG